MSHNKKKSENLSGTGILKSIFSTVAERCATVYSVSGKHCGGLQRDLRTVTHLPAVVEKFDFKNSKI